jgi:hypothetical protein
MVEGETMTPVPEGIISTSTGPVNPEAEVIEEELPDENSDNTEQA